MIKLRFALIGLGQMGKKYAKIIQSMIPKSFLLTAICTRSQSNIDWAKENLDEEALIFQETEQLFAPSAVDTYDVVLIVTPHKLHPELAMKAFQAGKHVLCDKPAGISVLQAQKMNEEAIKSGKKFAMMFQQRTYEKYQKIKELIENESIGQIRRVSMVHTNLFRTEFYHNSSDWRSSWQEEGGGVLINQGQHVLDIWQWLFGMPKKLQAYIPFGKYNDFTVDDEATLIMEYPNKMTGTLIISTGEPYGESRLEISGTKGKMILTGNTLSVWYYKQDIKSYSKTAQVNDNRELDIRKSVYDFYDGGNLYHPYEVLFQNFKMAVLSDEPLLADGLDGIHPLMLANAAYFSAWKNKRVRIPIDMEKYEAALKQH